MGASLDVVWLTLTPTQKGGRSAACAIFTARLLGSVYLSAAQWTVKAWKIFDRDVV